MRSAASSLCLINALCAALRVLEGEAVAKVLVVVKVYPESIELEPEVIIERIRNSLPHGVELLSYDVEPVAFGLNALRLYLAMPEETEGGTEPIEAAISSIEGVSNVDVEVVHRMSF